MAIKKGEVSEPKIETDGIANLRYYKSPKGTTIFVNGFCYNMITKQTDVIYTNGNKGIPMTLPVATFKKNFRIE